MDKRANWFQTPEGIIAPKQTRRAFIASILTIGLLVSAAEAQAFYTNQGEIRKPKNPEDEPDYKSVTATEMGERIIVHHTKRIRGSLSVIFREGFVEDFARQLEPTGMHTLYDSHNIPESNFKVGVLVTGRRVENLGNVFQVLTGIGTPEDISGTTRSRPFPEEVAKEIRELYAVWDGGNLVYNAFFDQENNHLPLAGAINNRPPK